MVDLCPHCGRFLDNSLCRKCGTVPVAVSVSLPSPSPAFPTSPTPPSSLTSQSLLIAEPHAETHVEAQEQAHAQALSPAPAQASPDAEAFGGNNKKTSRQASEPSLVFHLSEADNGPASGQEGEPGGNQLQPQSERPKQLEQQPQQSPSESQLPSPSDSPPSTSRCRSAQSSPSPTTAQDQHQVQASISASSIWEVVYPHGLNARATPNFNSMVVCSIPVGGRLVELSRSGDWIRHASGWSLIRTKDTVYAAPVADPSTNPARGITSTAQVISPQSFPGPQLAMHPPQHMHPSGPTSYFTAAPYPNAVSYHTLPGTSPAGPSPGHAVTVVTTSQQWPGNNVSPAGAGTMTKQLSTQQAHHHLRIPPRRGCSYCCATLTSLVSFLVGAGGFVAWCFLAGPCRSTYCLNM